MKTLKLLVIFGFINLCRGLDATTYYVDQGHANAKDNNPGTETLPWLTIGKAASTLVAGDTVYIKQGNYSITNKIVTAHSGSYANYITYAAWPGNASDVIIDGTNCLLTYYALFYITQSYIKVIGLKFTNSQYSGIWACGSYNVIQGNKTYQTASSGIASWGGQHITIDGNEIRRGCWDYRTGGQSGGIQESLTISGANYVDVLNNHVYESGRYNASNGKEGIDVKDGSKNVRVYNNLVHDTTSVGIYLDARGDESNIDVFNNIVHDSDHSGIVVASEESGPLQNVRVFNNTVYNNAYHGIVVGWNNSNPLKNIRIFNNTCYNNLNGIVTWTTNGDDIVIKNNIVSQNTSQQLIKYYLANVLFTNNLIDGTSLFFGVNPVYGTPMFEDPVNGNLYLRSNSPAINAGTFLAQTTSSGTGTIVPVNDAVYFINGSSSAFTCKIKIGSNAPVKLVSVDYTNNALTIDTSISWNIGDNVSYTYTGTSPDIGAKEYDICGHWRLDGDTSDASPFLNTGTVYGAPLWNTNGEIEGDLIFDGINDYVDCGNNDSLKPKKDDFTIECWIKPTSLPASYAGIIYKGNGNVSTQDGWVLRYYSSTGKLYFHMGDGTNNLGGFFINYVLPLNEWTHIDIVVKRTEGYSAYINGQFINSYAINTSAYEVNGLNLRIGKDWYASDYFFTGEIDDVKIYRTALNAVDIFNNYAQ